MFVGGIQASRVTCAGFFFFFGYKEYGIFNHFSCFPFLLSFFSHLFRLLSKSSIYYSICMSILPKLSILTQIAVPSVLLTVTYLHSGVNVIHADSNTCSGAQQVKDTTKTSWKVLYFAQPPKRWWEVVDEHSSVSIATDHFQFGIWNPPIFKRESKKKTRKCKPSHCKVRIHIVHYLPHGHLSFFPSKPTFILKKKNWMKSPLWQARPHGITAKGWWALCKFFFNATPTFCK